MNVMKVSAYLSMSNYEILYYITVLYVVISLVSTTPYREPLSGANVKLCSRTHRSSKSVLFKTKAPVSVA